eukprot:3344561-Amphidinium_carterae.2
MTALPSLANSRIASAGVLFPLPGIARSLHSQVVLTQATQQSGCEATILEGSALFRTTSVHSSNPQTAQ